jgi:hypothetical protein
MGQSLAVYPYAVFVISNEREMACLESMFKAKKMKTHLGGFIP